jgi:predicted ATPase/class 3 adenylate cyclase
MIVGVRSDLPSGTVTFLFTDVERSTRLLREVGAEAYAEALAEHRRLVRAACATDGGAEVDTQGDAFFFAFPSALGAVAAAQGIRDALEPGPIRVRMGLHTGAPLLTNEGYVGDDVHFAARVAASGHGDQILLSQSTRELVVGYSVTDLGEHRLKDIEEPASLYQLGTKAFPPLKTISNTNLPRPASSFVGRERELAEIVRELRRGTRLLTLSGPGGSGKTRLAIEAAASVVASYKAGVFWVGLASLRDSSLVLDTIAQTLGARDGLEDHIGERELLLLLDNLEQVIEAAPRLSGLLEACPNLTLLCTSRELLRVHGEVRYQVPPLASTEAVTLFCERSRLESTAELAELCGRLDDLPLAVELAAARTRALSPAQILERLSQRLDLLQGDRDADPRQQTLRATIAWSHDLLSDDEQSLFRALSVFAGGCAIEAAENVADADLDLLQSLVEKSLLRFTDERYWMLETIREYALERLDEFPDAKTQRDRHARYFLGELEERRPHIRGTRRPELLAWFDAEQANLRAALDRLERAAPPDAARMADHLAPFWAPRGQIREGRERFEALLAHDGLLPETRVMLLSALAFYESRLGDTGAAESHAHEALRLIEEAGRARNTAVLAMNTLGYIALYGRRDYGEARQWGERMLAAAGDDMWLRSLALGLLANLEAETGSELEARRVRLEVIQASRAAGDVPGEIIELVNLGWLELAAQDFEAARRLAQAAIDKIIGEDYHLTIGASTVLGIALVGLGRRGEARDTFGNSLALIVTSGMSGERLLAWTLVGIASAIEQPNAGSAARLLGAVERMDDEEGFERSAKLLEFERRLVRSHIDALGAENWARELAVGATMTQQRAIDLAQSLVERDHRASAVQVPLA